MSDPFIGEIRMFAGNFAPRGWALCDGQLLSVSQNDALFSLLGTIYGGDGRVTFGLPDVRGRIPIHAGTGPGLWPRRLGAKAGVENVTLTDSQLPPHTHTIHASTDPATTADPDDAFLAAGNITRLYREGVADSAFAPTAVTLAGGNGSHTNIQPFLCVHFIIALFGTYPSRH